MTETVFLFFYVCVILRILWICGIADVLSLPKAAALPAAMRFCFAFSGTAAVLPAVIS